MPQDAFTLKFLCEELNSIFADGKVNRITQPDNDQVNFTVYTGKKTHKLLLCVNPSTPRIGIIEEEKESPLTAPNFCMLLRKHLLSATIKKISLVGFDRIVKIDLIPSNEFFDVEPKTIFVELMGRYSNIILTENGKILGGNRGINVFDNGVRPLFVGKEYLFPPVGDKKVPSDKTLIEYFNAFNGDNLADYICKGVQGLALSTAQEMVSAFYKNSENQNDFANSLFKFINRFIDDTKASPTVFLEGDMPKDICVFPYDIKGEKLSFDSLWQAEEFYFSKRENLRIFTSKKSRIENLVSALVKKAKKKLSMLKSREKEALLSQDNKIKGELILSNIYAIKQGQSECSVYNYYDNREVVIGLDQNLSPSKNAEAYFKKYNKQKRTLEMLKPQLEQIENDLSYYQSVLDEVAIAETISDLRYIANELEEVGIIKVQKTNKKPKKETPFREYLVQGYKVKVGRNNAENDKLTFSAKGLDVWLHVKDYHSSHLIVESNGKEVPNDVIKISAEICAYYSKCRNGGKTEVVYTLKKHVKKPSKSKLGFCTYENFKSLTIIPNKHPELLKID